MMKKRLDGRKKERKIWKSENIEKVRRDEAEHEEKLQQQRVETNAKDQENLKKMGNIYFVITVKVRPGGLTRVPPHSWDAT